MIQPKDINQCDGCACGDMLIAGTHYDERGKITSVCQAKRYGSWSFTDAQVTGDLPDVSVSFNDMLNARSQAKLRFKKDPYVKLKDVYEQAVLQASGGKGKERHANEGEPFEKQKICEIRRRVGSGYTLGQAIKKSIESKRLPRDRAVAELLGAMNYLAAEVICLGEKPDGDTD